MDYKVLAERIKCPNIQKCPFGENKMYCVQCQYKICDEAATAITDLLARAEAAEARVRELETSFRTEKCENGPECVELGRARKRAEAADAGAEKAERERDAAIYDLTYIARTYPVDLCDDLVCQYCKHYQNVNTGCPGWTENDCFEWRGKKEE